MRDEVHYKSWDKFSDWMPFVVIQLWVTILVTLHLYIMVVFCNGFNEVVVYPF